MKVSLMQFDKREKILNEKPSFFDLIDIQFVFKRVGINGL